MQLSSAGHVLESPRTLWIVAGIVGVLFLATNLPWQLDDYDQAKQSFTSFEMVKEGHWLYQRTPHERIATKPPLVGWISAAVFEVTRSWDVAWRLPSLGAAIALSILLFRAANNAYGAAGGLIALSAFAFNLLSPRLASLVRTDMPLALVVFLIGLEIWKHVHEQRSWTVPDRLSIFAALTAAMLIKGPIVYAFLLPGIALFQWQCRRDGGRYSWCGWWPWLASLAIFLLWVIGGSILIPNFYDQVVVREFVGRLGETVHRPQPIYFYLPHLLHKFAPWSVFMVAIAIVDLRLRQWKLWEGFRKISPETRWLICWSLGGLLVMSLIPSKRVDRIFPIIPPLCLLLVAHLQRRFYQWSAVALLLSILCAGGYSALKIASGYRGHRDALSKFGQTIRTEAKAHHWRYEVVEASEASDEGLLLYLQKLHFVRPESVLAMWNEGNVDALIVPRNKAAEFVKNLPGGSLSSLRSGERKGVRGNYVLIAR